MKKVAAIVYGFVGYALAMASFVYLGASLANVGVPNAIDSQPTSSLGFALTVNLLLVGLFAAQHTLMARPGFKARWTRIVPSHLERSTYVLLSAVAMFLLLGFWQPLGGPIWNVEEPTARAGLFALYGVGWAVVVGTTFLINHFDLFGLRQVVLHAQGRDYTPLQFDTPGPYRWIRHPLYFGWLMVFWITPTMTASHLVLALLISGYIFFAIPYEERDLEAALGEDYASYRRNVPMLVPGSRAASARSTAMAGGVR